MTGAPVYAALRAVAEAAPDAPAMVGHDGTVTSYGRLLEAVDTHAESLGGAAGARPVVGLAVDDPLTFVAAYFAAAKVRYVAVLLDSRATPEEQARLAAKFDLDLLVGEGGVEPVAGGSGDGSRRPHAYRPDDFVVHCTSGSTGVPKGIVMSQAAVMERVRSWSLEGELTSSDVVLCALPLWHGHGIDVLALPTFLNGAKAVFTRGGQLTARGLARVIQKHAVTIVSGLPVMYQMLVAADGVDRAALGSLRLALTGSAPISADTQARFGERFGLPLRQGYGLGEIGIITYDAKNTGPGTIGLPISGIDWRFDPGGTDGTDSTDGGSELLVRGPALARGYYRDPEAEAAMFVDGWLRTHDLVVAEPDGWFIRGRKSTFINVTGNKVAPIEVETALRACEGVADCAVVGLPDGEGGEQIAALVVGDATCDPNAVRQQMGARMLPYQLPQKYAFAASLPRTPVGKTDYEAVKRVVRGGAGARTS
ncbi:class I adenylate-forming enzyme family protein [Streptomyces sp. NPDC041068]|uniref:class I adenylate-forming enzyme family protein n=1 Tax=Streptomyces sp. NPDC041068 TaxID=3155130 RepID=UPI0033F00DF1